MQLQSLIYWLVGWYLRLAGGEVPRWLPVGHGPHHRFDSIEFDGNQIKFIDATNQERAAVSLLEDFGEVLVACGNGEVLRLIKSGRETAHLIYPDGETVERLKASRYLHQIYRHALTSYFVGGELGGVAALVASNGELQLGHRALPLTGSATWSERLNDGSLLERRADGLVVHQRGVQLDCYVWDRNQRRLLRCDFNRSEIHFIWATHAQSTTASLLDGVLTVDAEDGSVQLWYYATKQRGEAIDCVGPGGLAVSRAAGSDRLWIFQHDELVGVAEFVPNAGIDDNGRSYHRWAFAAVGYADLPRGTPAASPLVTLLVMVAACATPLALADEQLAMYLAVPIAVGIMLLVAWRELSRLVREVWQ